MPLPSPRPDVTPAEQPRRSADLPPLPASARPGGTVPQAVEDNLSVLDLATSPDGKLLAAACSDGSIRIYDATTRAHVRTLSHAKTMIQKTDIGPVGQPVTRMEVVAAKCEPVRSVVFTPDGKTLFAVGGRFDDRDGPNSVNAYEVSTGRTHMSLQYVHAGTIFALAVSPDGKRLVTGGRDKSILIWDIPTAKLVHTLEGHTDAVRALAFAPGGERFASASFDGTIKVWTVDGTLVETLPGNKAGLNDVAYAPDGKALVAGGGREVILFDWRKPNETSRSVLPFRKGNVLTVAFAPDGKTFAAAGGRIPGAAVGADREAEVAIERLRKVLDEKRRVVMLMRAEMIQVAQKEEARDIKDVQDRNATSLEEYRALSNQLLTVEIEIAKAEARLAQLQSEATLPAGGPGSERELRNSFNKHPKAAGTVARLEEANQKHAALSDKVSNKDDPSLLRLLREKKDLMKQLESLWEELKPEFLAANRGIDREVREAELALSSLNTHRASLGEKMSSLSIRQRPEGAEALRREFAREDLRRLEQHLGTFEASLQQLEFEQARNAIRRPDEPDRLAELRVWDVATKAEVVGVVEPTDWIEAIAYLPGGKRLVTGGGAPGSGGFLSLRNLAVPGRLDQDGPFELGDRR